MIEILMLFFIVVGIAFDLFGCLGLIRMPDIYNRLQTSTKCVTLGTCSILFAVFVKFGFTAAGVKALLCILFLLLTAPVSAHALARGTHRSGVKLWEKSVCDKYAEDRKV
ncbi:MAG TPA: monovalent cation/H(+) antiporter subunit G [Patescibacteria group bacterium]|nr:monovalent cation/H(+) antiporter subunit G [Patescibacteria group bacterium]